MYELTHSLTRDIYTQNTYVEYIHVCTYRLDHLWTGPTLWTPNLPTRTRQEPPEAEGRYLRYPCGGAAVRRCRIHHIHATGRRTTFYVHINIYIQLPSYIYTYQHIVPYMHAYAISTYLPTVCILYSSTVP